jgi:hypothetical protein
MPTPNRPEREDPVIVDINDTSLAEGVEQEIDLKEDWQARACPPPRARYALALFVEDDKMEQMRKQGFKKDDPNGYYYRKQVICKIQDPTGKWQDSVVYWTGSTGVPKGKKTSPVAGILGMMKVKMQGKMNDLALIRLFVKALQKFEGIILYADCDWGGWDKDSKRSDIGAVALIQETGKLANTMLNFPKKADGSYQHIVHTKEGAEIIPKLKVIKWWGKEAPKAVASPQQQANGAQKPVVSAPKPVATKGIEVIETAMDIDVPIAGGGGAVLEKWEVEFGEDGEVVLDM